MTGEKKKVEVIQIRGGPKHVRPDPSIETMPSSRNGDDTAPPVVVLAEDESSDVVASDAIQPSLDPTSVPNAMNLRHPIDLTDSPLDLNSPTRPFDTSSILKKPSLLKKLGMFVASAVTIGVATFAVIYSHHPKPLAEPPQIVQTPVSSPVLPPVEDKIFTCTDNSISFKFKLDGIGTSQYVAAMVSNGWNNVNLRSLCSMSLDQQTSLVETYDTQMFRSWSYDELTPVLDLTKDVLTINKDKVQRLNLENLKDGRNNVINLNETFTYPIPLEEKVQSKEDRLHEASRLYMITNTSNPEYKPLREIVQEAGVTVKEIREIVEITRAELKRYQIAQRDEDIWRGYIESGCLKKSEYVKSIAEEYGLSRSRVYTILRNMALEVPDAPNCY
jgi:predicted transcriptional regulator